MPARNAIRLVGAPGSNKVMAGELSRLCKRALGIPMPNPVKAGTGALVYPFDNYLNTGSTIAWVIGFILMFPLTAMTLLKIDEVAEVTVGNRPIRLLPHHVRPPASFHYPKVSIQVPAYRENPAFARAC